MSGKHWTEDEVEYLIRNYGRYSIPGISETLGRTSIAVLRKAKKLNLGPVKTYTERVTAAELASSIGRDRKTVLSWVKQHGLKRNKKVMLMKKKYYMIKISDFWEFAKENRNLMKWEVYKRGSLVPEPEWLDEEIKEYMSEKKNRHRKLWTRAEDCYLKEYLKQGKSIREISVLMNRTYQSIKNRMRIKGLITHKKLNFRPIEDEMIKDMIKKGMSYHKIADELGRSYASVWSRYDRIRG